MKKILLFAHDPGGANTIIPLIKPLQVIGHEVCLYGKKIALSRYKQFGFIGNNPDKNLCSFLRKIKPDIVITGTSSEDFTERFLWQYAKQLGIPSIAILDQWINYGIRFSKYPCSKMNHYFANKDYSYLPSKIFVMDELAHKEAIDDGLSSNLLEITGQPYFEYLVNEYKSYSFSRRYFGKKIVTFISEPIYDTYGSSLGYDEKSSLKQLIRSLVSLDEEVTLIVKIHPRENSFKIPKQKSKVKIFIDQDSNAWDLLKISDVICGMTSMVLLESVMVEKKTLSIQIGRSGKSNFILEKQGVLSPVLTSQDLNVQLKKLLSNKNFQQQHKLIYDGAIQNIINSMERLWQN